MGDYLEEILDTNDLELDLMAALDDEVVMKGDYDVELPADLDIYDELDADYFAGA